ncbi:MAG: GNAT family N-acetyltransferase [Methanobacteriota archaeon]|nr:MAG: GNAT family N-acetyltransferase [Euryarchaeota archaeon]
MDYVKSIQEGRYHIIWILVDKEARRKGIAKSLIYELQKRGKREGIGKIWTEAEDERTEELYQSLGGIVDHLENFWIDLNFDLDEDPNDHELLFEDGELVDVIPRKISIRGKEIRWNNNTGEVFAGYKRIIGDYLTPEFDLSQLTTSVGTMAQDFVWGDTTPMEMVEYTLENGKILAILTQYVRVYQKGEVNNEEIMGIIKDVVHRLACKNYEAVDVQVLRSRKLGKTLLATGFAKVEEDPVFQINCHKID